MRRPLLQYRQKAIRPWWEGPGIEKTWIFTIEPDFDHLKKEPSRANSECPAAVVKSPEVHYIQLRSVNTLEGLL